MPWFVLALTLVTGCGGSSGEPRTVPPVPSASPSPSPSASLTPEEQVLAAVRAYYEAVNHAAETGDTTAVLATTLPNCTCRSLVSYIAGLRAKGQRLRNARNELGGMRVTQVTKDFAVVSVNYLSPAHQVVDAKSGKVLDSFPSKQFQAQVTVKAVASAWLVAVEREVS
ncbi:MAG: hypothetical protein QOJ79_2506 [Actinomycetota bacterium]|jgi:hypothetical protein|nr:hypothetical protein [Actinomycetota bacterium]